MKVVRDKIFIAELTEMSKKMHGGLVKVVVDLNKNLMAVDAGMHVDLEQYLLEELESQQSSLWGINLYPALAKQQDWIEFDSMINMRPFDENMSRGVDNLVTQKRIIELVNTLVQL
ncbi:hypothetical protein KBB68_03030 [Candidatus Babeliales bacterium]|nr:hypothetical protein [Candidatus Babeliales bacterium]